MIVVHFWVFVNCRYYIAKYGLTGNLERGLNYICIKNLVKKEQNQEAVYFKCMTYITLTIQLIVWIHASLKEYCMQIKNYQKKLMHNDLHVYAFSTECTEWQLKYSNQKIFTSVIKHVLQFSSHLGLGIIISVELTFLLSWSS